LLAGCGSAATNNASGNAAAPSNAITPGAPAMPANLVLPGGEGDAAGPGAGGPPGNALGDRGGNREELLASCTAEATAALPAGTDAAGLCGCAVDRALAGVSRGDAMRQCAAERNVQLPAPGR
jgi:hypothetical protein